MYTSFLCALNGLRAVLREERNFQIEIGIGVLVIASAFFFQFSFIEMALCFLAVGMVLAAEIVNTALEDLCDKVEPQRDAAIGKIKDIMAAYVLVSCLAALAIGIVVFKNHFLA